MSAQATSTTRNQRPTAYKRHNFVSAVAKTAGFNSAAMLTAGLGGILIARAIGPAATGDYAAITAWFSVSVMLGELGQPAALCYFASSSDAMVRDYLATSRALMLTTGTAVMTIGFFTAPILAHGLPALRDGYRLAFAAAIVTFVSASYMAALQARDITRWNYVRLSQPLLSFVAIVTLWRMHLLTLSVALIVLAVTLTARTLYSYWCCRVTRLTPGRVRISLIRPLASYGIAQIGALAPATLNMQLDQLILSQTVRPAALGNYAVAVTATLVPLPAVTAIGNVVFPRLAARLDDRKSANRLQRAAIGGSLAISLTLLTPICITAHWIVPVVYGAGYSPAVGMIWILAPGSVFLACGQVVGDVLRGRSHPATVAWAQGLAALFTVVLLLVLLPTMGVPAAAVASTVSYGVATAVMLRRLQRLPRHARTHAAAQLDGRDVA